MEVTVDFQGGMKFAAQCGKHEFIIDLPEESGGTDEGPTPPECFLASLGSCVGVYVAGFCRNNGIDAKDLRISITADKIQHPTRLDNIDIQIFLPEKAGEREAALLSVAKRCLIHNTLHGNPQVDIELKTV